jgi:energy-coupling factor transporter ATP-binding protein EcfA2
MYTYGNNWQQGLKKVLKRLALNEKPGFLVLDGAKGSGKTDLLDLVKKVTQHQITMEEIKDEENFNLSKQIFGKKYLSISLGATNNWASIPTVMLDAIIEKACANGIKQSQNIILMWDNFDKAMAGSNQEINKRFLEEVIQPLAMYNNMTIICSLKSIKGTPLEHFNTGAFATHFIHLGE